MVAGEADIKSATFAPLQIVLLVILHSMSFDTCSASLGPSEKSTHTASQLLISSGAVRAELSF
jgi:hypothetical protein